MGGKGVIELKDYQSERFDCATPIPAFEKFVPAEDAFISYVVAFIPDGMGEARPAFGVLFDGAFQEFDCRPATSRKADVAEWVDLVRKAAFPKLSEVEREFARIPLPKSGDSWAVEVLPANRACEFDRRMDTKGYAVRLADGRRGAEVVIVVDSEYREVRYIQGNSSDPTTRLLCELFAAVGGLARLLGAGRAAGARHLLLRVGLSRLAGISARSIARLSAPPRV